MNDTPLFDLLLDAIYTFEGAHYYHTQKKELIKIMIPAPFEYLLRHEMMQKAQSYVSEHGHTSNIMGYDVVIGYEMAVVIYHSECTMFLENAPIVRIPLQPGVSLQNKWNTYNRVMFALSKIDHNNTPGKMGLN